MTALQTCRQRAGRDRLPEVCPGYRSDMATGDERGSSGGEGAPERQGRMQDQEEFDQDPHGHDVSDQQPETQPAGSGGGESGGPEDEGSDDQAGRDDGGQATGNPASAG